MELFEFWPLFFSGLLSSTLLPGNSEILFAASLSSDNQSWLWLLTAVTLGNTAGGIISWGMGRLVAFRYPARALDSDKHARAMKTVQRWGAPALLLSWVPIVGDPLCIVAGWLNTNFILSLLYIAIGKLLRYSAIAYVML